MFLCFVALTVGLTGCGGGKSDDNGSKRHATEKENGVDYRKEMVGMWTIKELNVNGKWLNLMVPEREHLRSTIFVKDDGTYYGVGALGNGGGTYEIKGDEMITYVKGKVYFKYKILDFENGEKPTAHVKICNEDGKELVEARVWRLSKEVDF